MLEHDVAAESTTGPFGGQSGATFTVGSCLSFQVNRSGELDDSRMQTADHNTRGHLRNLCYQFPLFLRRILEPFLTVWFTFPSSLHLLSYCHQLLVLYLEKTTTFNFWSVSIQASVCSQVFFHPLFSISVLHAPLFFPAFFIHKLASCFGSFNKHWELSTAAWGSLLSCAFSLSWLNLLESLGFTEVFCLVWSCSFMLIFW